MGYRMSIEEVKNLSSGDVIDNIENIYDTLCEMIKSKENITLPNLIILASNMMVMLDIYKLSNEKKIDLVIAVLLQYIGNQDFEENEKTVLLEYVKNDLSSFIKNLIENNENGTVIISNEQENNVSSNDNEKQPKKQYQKGLINVMIRLCSCLARKQVKESEGVWV